MSSHREAPQIAKDPVADSTDVYAFVSPDATNTVTLISNYVPLQLPDGGPNFFEFGDDVLYQIHVDNTGNGRPDISYQFRFSVPDPNPNNFLYNDGPITSLDSPHWLRKQFYDLTVVRYGSSGAVTSSTKVASNLRCPPCNIGHLSTHDYPILGHEAIHTLNRDGVSKVFAGQRQEGFYVDLGAIFDLGILRPFQQDHTTFGLKDTGLGKMAAGVNSTNNLNVHSIAIQVPITELTSGGTRPGSPTAANAVIGVWATASRQASTVLHDNGTLTRTGAWTQVSRLGNPLVNEVLIPMAKKDMWNSQAPSGDSQFAAYYSNPALAELLPTLYPGVFPNLKSYNAGKPDRADLVAILLTGIPKGVVASSFTTEIGSSTTEADMLRLNVAIPPTTGDKRSNLGVIGGDVAGFPNGRRVFDDVTTIELRALAGATLPLVDKSYKADAAASLINEGLTSSAKDLTAKKLEMYEPHFPYLGEPHGGYQLNQLTSTNLIKRF